MANLGDLSGFKTYEDWQSANRAEGGSGNSAEVQAQYGGGAPAAPTSYPPAPKAIPAPTPYPSGGAGSDAAVTQANAAYNSGQRGSDPTKIPGFDASATRSSAATGSEDLARFSDQVLAQWEQYRVPGPGTPKYRSMRGAPGLYDKPTECPPGQGPSGPNETDPCTSKGYSADSGGAGGGSGAGGAGGAGAGVGTSGGGDPSGLGSTMETNLKGMLAGGTSRYSPQAIQGILAQIKQRIESSKRTQLRQSGEDAASRGMSRSGAAAGREAGIRRGAEAEFTSEYGNTLRAKIDADRQDKLDALDRSQRYLDSLRDEMYRRDMSAIQRQQFQANLDLAYANLANQREQFSSSQQYGKDMLAAQYGYQATFGSM